LFEGTSPTSRESKNAVMADQGDDVIEFVEENGV